jgi:hypothetical protein
METETTTKETTTQPQRHEHELASWRDMYPPHPCAEVFPMLGERAMEALVEDIKRNGQRLPIVLWCENLGSKTWEEVERLPVDRERYVLRGPNEEAIRFFVLDGRHRLQARAVAGLPIPFPPSKESRAKGIFIIKTDRDPARYVISANIRRRHLSKEQQATLIVKAIEAGLAGQQNERPDSGRSFSPTPGQRGGSTKDPALTAAIDEAAKLGISRTTVKNARAKVHGKPVRSRASGLPALPVPSHREAGGVQPAVAAATSSAAVNVESLVIALMPRSNRPIDQVVEAVSVVVTALRARGYERGQVLDGLRRVTRLVERSGRLPGSDRPPKLVQPELPADGLVSNVPPTLSDLGVSRTEQEARAGEQVVHNL